MTRRSRFPILNTPLGEVTPPTPEYWWLSGGISEASVVAAFAAKGAASQAASKTNLAGAGELIDGASVPSWSAATGWQWAGGGDANYDTSWKPTDPSSIIIRYSGVTSGTYTFLCGITEITPIRRYYLYPYDGGGGSTAGYGENDTTFAGVAGAGTMGLARNQAYADGSPTGTAISLTWNGGTAASLPIGGRFSLGVMDAGGGAKNILAVAMYSVELSAAQMLAVHTAMMEL